MTPTHLVTAKLLGDFPIQEFGERFADPLYAALKSLDYGDITGGDGQFDQTGQHTEWLSIDIRLVNLDLALEFARRTLKKLGAPPGSELQYTVKGRTYTLPIDDPLTV